MNLNGYYIEINRNNVESIIKILYGKGYFWSVLKHDLNETLFRYSSHINLYKKSHIIFYDTNVFYFETIIVEEKYKFFDINKLIREYKLKRILK